MPSSRLPRPSCAGASTTDTCSPHVSIVDPQTTWIEAGVRLEPDTVVHLFSILRGSTTVAEGAEIGPHAVVVDTEIGP